MDLADYDDYTLMYLLFILYTILFMKKKKLFLVPNYGLGRMDLADYDNYEWLSLDSYFISFI